MHFLRKIDAHCRDIRREALRGPLPSERRSEIKEYLHEQAIILAHVATSGVRLPDEARPCLLSVFLTLINVCERLARNSGEEHRSAATTPVPALAVAWRAGAAR